MNNKNDESTDILKQTWPAANEDSVRYNVPDEAMHLYEEKGKGDYKFVYSVPDDMIDVIKQIDYETLVKEDIQEAVDEYLRSINYSGVNEFGESEYEFDDDNYSAPMFSYSGETMGYFEPLDRTIEHSLLHENLYTIDFVRFVQKILKTEYPLWRLHICEYRTDGEEGLMIYPEVVRVGEKQCTSDDLETELDAWRKKIFNIREKTRGPRRRQLEYLKPKLAEAAKQLTIQLKQKNPKPFVVIAAFDNWRGKTDRACFWTLQLGGDLTLGPSSPLGMGIGDRFRTNSKGLISFGKKDLNSEVYRLYQNTFPFKKDMEHYDFVLSAYNLGGGGRGEPDGREWKFHLGVKEIISDVKLQKSSTE